MSGFIDHLGAKSGMIGRTGTDYEEGDWTPTLVGATPASSGSVTYDGITNGRYTKIGRWVFVRAYIQTSADDSNASGNVHINGLPFTSDNFSGNVGGGSVTQQHGWASTNPNFIQIQSGGTHCRVDTGSAKTQASEISDGGETAIAFTASYMTAITS